MKILYTLALLALITILPEKAWAQLGSGSLEPLRFTFSDNPRLAIPRVEIADLPRIGTAVEGGPAWYAGSRGMGFSIYSVRIAVSVYSVRGIGNGYALSVHQTDDVSPGQAQAVIPVTPTVEIGNEEQLDGCASRSGDRSRWLATPESRKETLSLPSSLVQPVRFC